MSRKKRQTGKALFQSDIRVSSENTEHEPFKAIYSSLVLSSEFQKLPHAIQHFYFILRAHTPSELCQQNLWRYKTELMKLYGLKNEYELIEHLDFPPKELCFVFPGKHAEVYGYGKTVSCKYLNHLTATGFIEKVICGKKQRKQNLYAFSDKWRTGR